jgi:hypothetical protein
MTAAPSTTIQQPKIVQSSAASTSSANVDQEFSQKFQLKTRRFNQKHSTNHFIIISNVITTTKSTTATAKNGSSRVTFVVVFLALIYPLKPR